MSWQVVSEYRISVSEKQKLVYVPSSPPPPTYLVSFPHRLEIQKPLTCQERCIRAFCSCSESGSTCCCSPPVVAIIALVNNFWISIFGLGLHIGAKSDYYSPKRNTLAVIGLTADIAAIALAGIAIYFGAKTKSKCAKGLFVVIGATLCIMPIIGLVWFSQSFTETNPKMT